MQSPVVTLPHPHPYYPHPLSHPLPRSSVDWHLLTSTLHAEPQELDGSFTLPASPRLVAMGVVKRDEFPSLARKGLYAVKVAGNGTFAI